jgi:hypothetical protein
MTEQERAWHRIRAQAQVDALLRRLREKASHVVLPPPEEAWKMVDFASFDEPLEP